MVPRFFLYLLFIVGLFLSSETQVNARRTYYVASHSSTHSHRYTSGYRQKMYNISIRKNSSNRGYSSKLNGNSKKNAFRLTSGRHHSNYTTGVPRDVHGKIKRSSSARHEFMVRTGYPHGRPGYVIDHIIPLKRGGSDTPDNMQWQTKAEAKAKDKWE